MAGIGFRLNRYFNQENSFSKVQGSIYAIILSCGPWLMSILSIFAISFVARKYLSSEELLIFKSIISYTYAISLIFFGAIELPVTRYLADKIYQHDFSTFRPIFFMMAGISVLVGGAVGHLVYYFTPLSLEIAIGGVLFLCATIVIWIAMVFLSSARNFNAIVICFFVGSIAGIALSLWLGKSMGLAGLVWGYALGQLILALGLASVLLLEFSGKEYFTTEIAAYFGKGRVLMAIGVVYYLGIWVDKFIFWHSSEGVSVIGPFYTHPYYDTAMFLAYLTIVPSFAAFLINVETEFYTYYNYYYRSIEGKKSLPFLEKANEMIIRKFRDAILNMLRIQVFVSVTCWVLMPKLLELIRLSPLIVTPLKYGILGSFLQVNFLVMNIILLYFQDYRSVLRNYSAFFLCNLALGVLSLYGGYRFHGIGYALSALITLFLSYHSLNKRLKLLNFYTFMNQPIMIPKSSAIH